MYGLPSVVSNSCSGFFRTSKISRTGKNLSNPQVFDRKQGAAAGPAIRTVAAQARQTRPDQAISAVGHDRRALTASGGICNKQCDKRVSPYGIVFFFSAGRIFFVIVRESSPPIHHSKQEVQIKTRAGAGALRLTRRHGSPGSFDAR